MSFTFLFILGFIGILLVQFLKRPILAMVNDKNKIIRTLSHWAWYQNPWLAGLFIFAVNAVFFSITVFILFLLMYFLIPYLHFFVMVSAVLISLYAWILFNKVWSGTKRDQLIMGAVGSSFYILLTIVFVYWFITLKPDYPGQDLFMAALGLMMAILVTTVAAITCFLFTGFSSKAK